MLCVYSEFHCCTLHATLMVLYMHEKEKWCLDLDYCEDLVTGFWHFQLSGALRSCCDALILPLQR